MRAEVKETLIFLAGVGVGALGTYIIFDKRFNTMLDEEVEKVRAYRDSAKPDSKPEEELVNPDTDDIPKPNTAPIEKPPIFDYARLSINKHKEESTKKEEEHHSMHLITPSKYEDLSYDYESHELICYKDGVVTDITDKIIFNALDDMVPNLSMDDFDDRGTLYVADDDSSKMYTVSLDNRTYSDVFGEDEEE